MVCHLLAFDKTHLTNLPRDKAAWLVYKCTWVLVALLPIPPKQPKDDEIHRSWHVASESILKPIAEMDIVGPG